MRGACFLIILVLSSVAGAADLCSSIFAPALSLKTVTVHEQLSLDEAVKSYLSDRLEILSDAETDDVGEILKTLSWETTKILGKDSEDDGTAAYLPHLKKIRFEMPAEYKNTWIQWFSLFHEMEHAIQHIRLLHSFSDHSQEVSPFASNEFEYLSEQGAMTAEWVFLQYVPEKEIAKAVEQVRAAKDIETSYKQFYLRVLQNSRLPLEQYLAREHAAHRYSREFFTNE